MPERATTKAAIKSRHGRTKLLPFPHATALAPMPTTDDAEARAALDTFAETVTRALRPHVDDAADARAPGVATPHATRPLGERRDLGRTAELFAVLETMLAALDRGDAPAALRPAGGRRFAGASVALCRTSHVPAHPFALPGKTPRGLHRPAP
jgi:hypothetical protein